VMVCGQVGAGGRHDEQDLVLTNIAFL
jgi:hypothetical protein